MNAYRFVVVDLLEFFRRCFCQRFLELHLSAVQVRGQCVECNGFCTACDWVGARNKSAALVPIPNGGDIQHHHEIAARNDDMPYYPVNAVPLERRLKDALLVADAINLLFCERVRFAE